MRYACVREGCTDKAGLVPDISHSVRLAGCYLDYCSLIKIATISPSNYGGARTGSGRKHGYSPYGEPTQQVQLPSSRSRRSIGKHLTDADDYAVNGKPALDWVVERQCVKIDKASGIVNAANDCAIDTMHNPKYPLELFQRVITVSLETMKIVNELPKLEVA